MVMAAELDAEGFGKGSSVLEDQIFLSSANIPTWEGHAISIDTGAKGILYGTRHVYQLSSRLSSDILKAVHDNPSLTLDQLASNESFPIASVLKHEREQMAFARSDEGQRVQASLRRPDGGFTPSYPMTELIAASEGKVNNFIAIGNYYNVVSLALHFCAGYKIISSAEDVVQHFMTELMPNTIRDFEPDREKASFFNFLFVRVKYFMRDLARSKPLQAKVLSSMHNSISLFITDSKERELLDTLEAPEEDMMVQAQRMLEEEDPYAKRLIDLCESVGMNERETRAFVLKYWLEKSSKEIGSVLDLSKGAVDTIMWRLRDRVGSEGEDTVAARIWRNAV